MDLGAKMKDTLQRAPLLPGALPLTSPRSGQHFDEFWVSPSFPI